MFYIRKFVILKLFHYKFNIILIIIFFYSTVFAMIYAYLFKVKKSLLILIKSYNMFNYLIIYLKKKYYQLIT